jgi:hypothetical protein
MNKFELEGSKAQYGCEASETRRLNSTSNLTSLIPSNDGRSFEHVTSEFGQRTRMSSKSLNLEKREKFRTGGLLVAEAITCLSDFEFCRGHHLHSTRGRIVIE